MRCFVATVVLFATIPLYSQNSVPPAVPPAGSNWQHVQALPVGASISVKTKAGHNSCAVKSVDADSLTCLHGKRWSFSEAKFRRSPFHTVAVPL